jgi:hypothetical protein
VRRFLAQQMRALRGDQSQADFSNILQKPQSVVSRLEDPTYGKWSLQSLFDVAERLDIAVLVRFVDYQTFLQMTNDFSEEAIAPAPFDKLDFEEPADGADQ